MKKIVFHLILFAMLFALIFWFNKKFIMDNFQPKELVVTVKFATIEEDIFQLYYRDVQGKLNETLSERVRVVESDQNQTLHFKIPDTLELSHIRFDFGNTERESVVAIHEIVFSYNGHKKVIFKEDFTKYFHVNKYAEQTERGFVRKVIQGRSDPFLASMDLTHLIRPLKERPNRIRVLLNVILSGMLSLSICLAIFLRGIRLPPGETDQVVFISAFLVIIGLPHLDEWFSIDDTNLTEKRELLKKPEMTIEDYDEYPEKFENFYNDNFGFRKKLVSWGAILKVKLFHTAPNFNSVIVGKDEWLFYWREPIIKSSYLHDHPFRTDSLGAYGKNFIQIKKRAEMDNKYFLATIFPNKHTIYGDRIPERIQDLQTSKVRRIDQFYTFLEQQRIYSVDNRQILLEQKEKTLLYLKNDSHWNAYGAYYAYHNILSAIRAWDNSIEAPIEMKAFGLKPVPGFLGGDLLPILGIDNSLGFFTDTYIKHTNLGLDLQTKKDTYGPGSLTIENLDCTNGKIAVFFGDSYSKELLKYLPVHFQKVIFIANIRIREEFIEDIDPDIIVYGIVERNLENFD